MKIIEVETKKQIELVEMLAKIIWKEHYLESLGSEQIDYMLNKFQSTKPIKQNIVEDGYIYYLFYLDDTPFGYMAIHPRDGKLFLSKLYIHKDFRGKGYSTKAFEFIEKYARHHQMKSIWLTCYKQNVSSLKVYEKSGFKQVSSIETDIGNGFIMDDYVMEKEF